MLSVKFSKIIRDLFSNKSRTLLAIIALAIGIAGVGFSLTSYSILSRELDKNYMNTNPASIIIETEKCDESFVAELKQNPAIEDIEGRKQVMARYKAGENLWMQALLFVVEDFNNIRIDKVTPEEGDWPAQNGEILLERAGVKGVKEAIGENITLKLPNEKEVAVKYIGKSYAPGLSPAWMEGLTYGFINIKTYEMLGGKADLNELHIIVKENRFNKREIIKTASSLKKIIESTGRKVKSVVVPKPGKHPHAGQMNSLIFLVQVLGVLSLILSSILTVNLISAQISQQKKQIGIMKVLGGSTIQIADIYIKTVVIIGTVALSIGIPVGLFMGNLYAKFTAGTLNFEILSNYVPHWVYFTQVILGIGLPLLAAMFPIIKGTRTTVYNTINDQGIDTGEFGSSGFDRHLERINFVERPVMLSLRNTFRKRGRFALTLATLAAGGAIFIVAMNFKDSLVYTINQVFETKKYDIQVTLSKPYSKTYVENTLKQSEGVEAIKCVGSFSAEIIRADGTKGEKFRMTAIPIEENLITPQIMKGKWLNKIGTDEIVINQMVFNEESEFQKIEVGQRIQMMVNGGVREFRVAGIAKEPASLPGGYIDVGYFNANIGSAEMTNELLVIGKEHTKESQIALLNELEKLAKDNGIDISAAYRLSLYKKIVDDHLLVIFMFLMAVAILIVIVGGMSLASTMGINVVERTREIGIMRSVGASAKSIVAIVVTESIITGVLSWIIAVAIAPPIAKYEADVFGKIFFGTGLDVRVSVTGSLMWLGFVVVIAVIASIYPALKASRISVREALRYE